MEDKINKELFWNKAAVSGLALGGISVVYIYLERLMLMMPAMIASPLLMVVKFAKFIGCILVMRYFIKSYADNDPAAQKRHAFGSGVLAAVLSSLIFAGVSMADIAFISTDYYMDSAKASSELMKTAMDSEEFDKLPFFKNNKALIEQSTEIMEQMSESPHTLAVNTFTSNFFVWSLYGIILAFILSRGAVSDDPFRRMYNEEQGKSDEERPDDQNIYR